MMRDRVISEGWWKNERLAGLPPVGRLSWLWLAAHADRDGFLCVNMDEFGTAVGIKSPATPSHALLLLSTFNVCLNYNGNMVWLPDLLFNPKKITNPRYFTKGYPRLRHPPWSWIHTNQQYPPLSSTIFF